MTNPIEQARRIALEKKKLREKEIKLMEQEKIREEARRKQMLIDLKELIYSFNGFPTIDGGTIWVTSQVPGYPVVAHFRVLSRNGSENHWHFNVSVSHNYLICTDGYCVGHDSYKEWIRFQERLIPVMGAQIDPDADDTEVGLRRACLEGDVVARAALLDYLKERNRDHLFNNILFMERKETGQ